MPVKFDCRTRAMAACLAATLFAAAGAQAEHLEVSLQWRSESRNDDQLAQSIERLYVVLYNTESLPTRRLRDTQGLSVEEVLRRNALFFGSFFPTGVDSVMCDLNPKTCSRERTPVPESRLASVDAHVGGYRKSPGRWRNGKGSVLNVPDLSFSKYTSMKQVEVAQADDLLRMLEQQNADCSQYGVTCEELVKKLNPHLFSAPAGKGYSGTVQATLPVAGVETRLTFDAESGLDAETLRRLPDEQKTLKERPTGAAPPDIRQEAVYDAKWDQRLQTVSPASEGIDALSPNIMSSGAVKFETSHEENDPVDDAGDALAEYSHLLELIGYPYHDETEIPDILKAPVSVAVFDTWVDTSHCDLGANIEPIEITAGGAVREPAPHCGDMLPAPNVIDDHGTHVVGIIAAAANDVGVLGLNPFAKVMLVQVDKSRLRVPDYREHLSDLLVQLYFGKEMKVVNMSWRYTNQTGEVDTIREKIEGLRYNTLIVAAAGNEKVDFNAGGCGELPACLVGVDNIMTVVGLSRDGDGSTLWSENGEGSNTSADFHIAAIAEDVVSTVYGGYLGMMSGTSQAAPQVSAAASLLYAIHESVHRVDEPFLPPQRVKNRLMYTADLIPTLLDKVKSGRLNVRRALEVGRTRLVLREDDGSEKTYVGNLTRFGNDPNHELILCKTADSDSLEIARKDLRRLYYDSLRDRYVVFRNSRSGDRNSPLERIIDCTLRTLTHEGEILTPDGPKTFQFWQIRDYVSPMFG